MATFLFDKTIFGPVISRRLGVSLGINLLPNDCKICTFDCIYCECGWNPEVKKGKSELPTRLKVKTDLERKLIEMKANNQLPDVITFAGNGEPTIHPHFESIIDDTLNLRNQYAPNAKVAVLSNSTMLHRPLVVSALRKVDDNILKLDTASINTLNLINQPHQPIDIDILVKQLQQFDGKLILQTMFLKGSFNGVDFDNTTATEIQPWMERIKQIRPQKVSIYSIARDTPASGLVKIERCKLDEIAATVYHATGIEVEVS